MLPFQIQLNCVNDHLFLLSFTGSLFSSFSSFTSLLLVIESPLPIHILRIISKCLSFLIIRLIPSNFPYTSIPSSFCFFALHLKNINCLILAHLKVSLMGQSLIVESYTTALFMTSFPSFSVNNDTYLLLYSPA